jgi:anthranilate phosphoribosyltransferase
VAIPQAIQRQVACCLVAAGESETLEQGLQRLRQA